MALIVLVPKNSWEIDYKALPKQIESQFRQSEQLLADNNINSPNEQPKLLKDERIWLPNDYIRTANYFREEYELHALIDDVKVRSNIAYSL
ncbi:hypothetical protein [Pseudodesulfovibrio portus]|nr:hypothetical protein [Pseudodesulfovibrio portus]